MSQTLAKREAEKSLMPPPPPPKRIKRPATVLDEDIYTNALSEIVARDFFPGLLETQIKQEYLDAVESKDREWIASSRKKLADTTSRRGRGRSVRTDTVPYMNPATPRPGDTPAGWEGNTPTTTVSIGSTSAVDGAVERKREVPDVSNLGLLSFQAKYTSEDNESFNKVLDKQNAKRRDKYRWIWNENKIPTARQIAHRQREMKRITARGENVDRYHTDEESRSRPQDQGLERNQGVGPIKTDFDSRPAKPSAWPSARPENQLMFLPSSIEDTHETIQQRAETESRAGSKRVLYQNTRLPDHPISGDNKVPPSPSISAIQDAISGRPRLSVSELNGQVANVDGCRTPRVNGYAFVDDEEPDANRTAAVFGDGDNDNLDLNLLGYSSSTPNPFQIAETRKRESLHHRMVDRVARNKRAERIARETKTPVLGTPKLTGSPYLDFGLKATPGASSFPGTTQGAVGKMLTPAAQKLLQRVGGATPRAKEDGFTSGRGKMWTPTPITRRR